MKSFIFSLFTLGSLFCSCSDAQYNSESHNVEQFNLDDTTKIKFEFRSTEDTALDALVKIQLSGWNLYSTFPYLSHDCQGPVSTFKISKEEFEDALLDLLSQYYGNLSANERTYLASAAVKAQDAYIVTTCGSTTESLDMEGSIAPPRKGMWIFQAILDQRDLVFKW